MVIAETILFLASEQARMLTGQDLAGMTSTIAIYR